MSVTGIFFYLITGGLIAFAIAKLVQLKKNRKIDRNELTIMISAIFLTAFGIAWSYTSILEDEPQAAVMGIVIFSGLGMVLGGWGFWKMKFSVSDSASAEPVPEKNDFSPRKIAATVLLALFVMTMPGALLIEKTTRVLKNEKQLTGLIEKTIMSNQALPGAIKKSIRYQVLLGPQFIPIEQRMMMSIASGVEPEKWVELFNFIAPEDDRIKLIDSTINTLYSWFDNEKAYPEIVISTDKYVTGINDNAGKIVHWTYSSFALPPCSKETVSRYQRGIYGSNINDLFECKPPENLRRKIEPVAAGMLKKTIASKKLPGSVSITEKLKAEVPAGKMLKNKNGIKNALSFGSLFWIFPIVLIITALLLAVRSVKDFIRWISWPVFTIGSIGFVTSFTVPSLGFLTTIPKELPANMAPPVLAMGQEIAGELMKQVGSGLFTPMLTLLITGSALIFYSYYGNIKSLLFRIKTAG